MVTVPKNCEDIQGWIHGNLTIGEISAIVIAVVVAGLLIVVARVLYVKRCFIWNKESEEEMEEREIE